MNIPTREVLMLLFVAVAAFGAGVCDAMRFPAPGSPKNSNASDDVAAPATPVATGGAIAAARSDLLEPFYGKEASEEDSTDVSKYDPKVLGGKFGFFEGQLEFSPGKSNPTLPPEVNKEIFDLVVELTLEDPKFNQEPPGAETVAEILVVADYLDISSEAAPIFCRNLARWILRSSRNFEKLLEKADTFPDPKDTAILATFYLQLFMEFLDKFGIEIRVSGQAGTICCKRDANSRYGSAGEFRSPKQMTILPSALGQIPKNLDRLSRFAVVAWFLKRMETSSLVLKDCPIASKDFEHITNLKLRELKLSGCKLTPKDVERLLARETIGNMAVLDLSHNDLGSKGAKAIADRLADMPNLTTLDISHNGIGPKGAKIIAGKLVKRFSLRTLDFWKDLVGTTDAKRPASMPNLTTLDISFNQIGKDAEHITRHVKDMPNLMTFNIGHNEIESESASSIAERWKARKRRALRFIGYLFLGICGVLTVAVAGCLLLIFCGPVIAVPAIAAFLVLCFLWAIW